MNPQKRPFTLLLITSFLLFITFTVYSFKQEMQRPHLPYLGQVSSFSLTNENGEEFGLSQLQNKVWIADFFFTSCGDTCPILSKNMASLSRTFERVPKLTLVSISVNPETDSPQTLSKYAEKFKKGKDNWHFLTGTRENITKLVAGSFKLGDPHEPLFHSTKLALVDKNGFIRGYYEGTEQDDVNKLFKDASALIKEKMYRGLIPPNN